MDTISANRPIGAASVRLGLWLFTSACVCTSCEKGGDPASQCQTSGECEVGDPCEDHGNCAENLCLEGADGSVCAKPCDDEDLCGVEQSCGLVTVSRDGEEKVEGACVATHLEGGDLGNRCDASEECRTGICHEGQCTELCTECGAGAVCEPLSLSKDGETATLDGCVWDVAAPEISLGPLEIEAEGSDAIPFTVPEGVLSFAVVIQGGADDFSQRIGITSLIAPDGTVLLDDADIENPPINPAAIRYPQASAALVPSTDDVRAAPQAGEYLLTVGIFDINFDLDDPFVPVAGTIDAVDIIFEAHSEPGGLIDMNFFFTPTAGEEVDDEYLAALIESIETYYAPAGIAIGEVSTGEIPDVYDSVSESDAIREFCNTYALPGPHRGAVNAFFVSEIEFAIGYTGGSPSPPGLFDVAASGIAIEMRSSPTETARLVAHELGHFLGLRHTTNFSAPVDGQVDITGYDAISDTPECTADYSLNTCPDQGNLMFPNINFGGDLALSDAQLRVIAGNPLVYELPRTQRCALTDATYDITRSGRAAGSTQSLDNVTEGSCGGSKGADRIHLFRVGEEPPARLEVQVLGYDFDPVVYVRKNACEEDAVELGCASGSANDEVSITIDAPEPGIYFIVVDAAEEGGIFQLEVIDPDAAR